MKALPILLANPGLLRQLKFEESSQRKYLRILEASPDMICSFDRYGRFVSASRACERLLGYTEEELLGRSYMDFVIPDHVQKTSHQAEVIMQGAEVKDFKNSYIRKDGLITDLMWSAVWDKEEEIMYCVARDITDLKKAQEALVKSNERFELATKATSDAVWEWDILTNEVFWTENYLSLFGYTSFGPQHHSSWYVRLHPDDCERVVTGIRKVIEEGGSSWNSEYRFKRADGSYAWVLNRALILRDNKGIAYRMVGGMQDISQRKEVEEQLALSEQRFRSMVQFGSDIVVVINADGDYSYISPAMETILGHKPEYLIGKNGFDFVHPEDIESTLFSLKNVLEKKQVKITPFRFKNSKGEWRWIECVVTDHSENPVIRGIVANCRDITEKKIADDQLSRLALLAKETINPVFFTDTNRKITWVNDAFLKMYEYTEQEVLGQNPQALLSGADTQPEAIEKKVVYESEIVYYSKTGQKKIVILQNQPIYDDSGKLNGCFSIHSDITEKIRLKSKLQKELKERQRKIARAVLAAQEEERMMVGRELHDNINQILATVKLFIETARMDEMRQAEMLDMSAEYLDQAINEIRSVSHRLTSYLHNDISLSDSLRKLLANLNLVNKTQVQLHEEDISENKLSRELKLAIYRIVQEQLNNVFKYADAKHAVINLRRDGNEIILEIVDNGCGFDPAQKKEGIGLRNIQSRAFAYNGIVNLISEPGRGCKLIVRFSTRPK